MLTDKIPKWIAPATVVASIPVHVADMLRHGPGISLPLSEYAGDANEGLLIMVAVQIGSFIPKPSVVRKTALNKYIPAALASGLAAYISLGESVLDIMPDNTMDVLDIPAGLLGAASGYVLARGYQKLRSSEYTLEDTIHSSGSHSPTS